MDLHQLRTFTAVAELGTLARACEALHLSQPAASGHVKALETEFGFPLFTREPKGLALTLAGTTILLRAQRILALAAELKAEARRIQGAVNGRLRLGAFFDPALLKLGELMQRLIAEHPMLDIEIHHRNSRAVLQGVRTGEFDVGMALCGGLPEDLEARPLQLLRYRVVAPAAWTDRVEGKEWKEVAALPWISAPPSGAHAHMATQVFEAFGFQPAKVVESDSEAIITSLVMAGVGLGLMREDLALEAAQSHKVYVLPEASAETWLMLFHVKARSGEAAIAAFMAAAGALWRLDHG
jgi:DNA-binding transcriptional LysR family regulator